MCGVLCCAVLCCQVAGNMVEMVKTGATGVNFDMEIPLKVRLQGL
jgi:hypothetical protein